MRLLALTENAQFVCYRYRLEAFRPALAECGWELDLLPRALSTASFLAQLPRIAQADVVVLQRRLQCWWKRRLLRKAAKLLVYDFDDALFLRDSNRLQSARASARWQRFQQTVRGADACFAGNAYLRAQAAQCTNIGRVHLMPTCVDHSRYRSAEHRRQGGDVQMVWVGSHSTLHSLQEAGPDLAEAALRLPGLAIKVICDVFPELAGLHIVRTPWSEATEAAEIAAADIGIAWLPDHPWSLGKCGLKVLQYMAAGLPVVANPIGVHQELVVHGETGFLAATRKEWGEAISTLADSPEMRRRMGRAGRARLIQRYSVQAWGPQFAAMIDRLARPAADAATTGARAA